jgi:glycosyltransferase involved in cell wall biosynthesis
MQPFVSLILPIYNEAAYIEKCIQAIMAQDYSGPTEILVVDGMSTDCTRTILEKFILQHSSLIMIENPGRIVPIGMNIALRQARGEIIIRVDGHCIIAPNYVSNCVLHIQEKGVAGVGGPMQTIGETYLASVIALAMSSPFGVGNSAFRTISSESMLTDTVPFPAYTRKIIQRAGLYDEELMRNQDDEYNYRIRALGGKILLAEDVRSTYFSRASLTGLWRQYFQYGLYKVRVMQKHPRQMSPRQFVPPLFVLALLASVLLALFPLTRFLSLVIPIVYLCANLAASILTAIRARKADSSSSAIYYSLLPIAFAILHLSYGLGFLLGLIKFWNRWGDRVGCIPGGEISPGV